MATSSTIIGSASMDLERAFRTTVFKIAEQLSEKDCQNIAYVNSCGPAPPGYDYRLHVFSTLESCGKIGPLKLDFLKETLEDIGRKDLLSVIAKYKKNPIYKEVRSQMKLKRRIKRKGKDEMMHSGTQSGVFSNTSTVNRYKETYALLLTQFSQMTISMRSALESDDTTHMKIAFSRVANDGDAVTRTLRKFKRLSFAGIKSDSSSSRESSAPGSTPSPRFSNSSGSSPESSLNRATTESELFERPCQVSSPYSNHMRFVFPILSASSPLKSNSNCEADYTDGTGDSGVGDISSHIPSKEALSQIDPTHNRRPDHVDDHCGDYPPGYMRLQFEEENRPQPNEYMMVKFDTEPKTKDSSSH